MKFTVFKPLRRYFFWWASGPQAYLPAISKTCLTWDLSYIGNTFINSKTLMTGDVRRIRNAYPSWATDPTPVLWEVSGFQTFVPFVFVLSFSLFTICHVSCAHLIFHMGILYWTVKLWMWLFSIYLVIATFSTIIGSQFSVLVPMM